MQRVYDRRAFLARTGVLGVTVAVPGWVQTLAAGRPPVEQDLIEPLREALQELSRETIAALCAFVVPGDDRLSRLQGTPAATPGALAARAEELAMDTLDRYFAFPDRLYVPVGVAALREMGGVPAAELPAGLRGTGALGLAQLDELLEEALVPPNHANAPASGFVALLLNLQAGLIVPASVARPGSPAPFAKLTYGEKARVFEDFESPRPRLLRALQEVVPERDPLREATLDEFNRLLKFVSGALLSLPALGTYSEHAVHEPGSETLRARPLGWELTGYLPGRDRAVEGHDELLGYYRGIR